MIKFKRHIRVNDQVFETWFGMEIKKRGGKANVSIYYYTTAPHENTSTNHLIKSNFLSKEDAVRYGVQFMRQMYKDMMERENAPNTEQE